MQGRRTFIVSAKRNYLTFKVGVLILHTMVLYRGVNYRESKYSHVSNSLIYRSSVIRRSIRLHYSTRAKRKILTRFVLKATKAFVSWTTTPSRRTVIQAGGRLVLPHKIISVIKTHYTLTDRGNISSA